MNLCRLFSSVLKTQEKARQPDRKMNEFSEIHVFCELQLTLTSERLAITQQTFDKRTLISPLVLISMYKIYTTEGILDTEIKFDFLTSCIFSLI